MKKTAEILQYYYNLEILPLYNWDRYLATYDNNWLIKGYDGRQKKLENNYLKELEAIIQDEYFTLIDDHNFRSKLSKWARINNIRTKYITCTEVINRMKIGFADYQMLHRFAFIQILKGFGYNIPEINSIMGDRDEINRIELKLQQLITQIGVLELELKDDAVKEKRSLDRQLLIMQLGLGFNYKLNSKDITVSEWIEMSKMLEDKAKNN
jgi:hypothetical protein